MASIVNSTNNVVNSVPVSIQVLLINCIIKLIKESNIFGSLPVELNFLSGSADTLCVRLNNDSCKLHEFVDGSYEAKVLFTVIYRKQNISSTSERTHILDLINELGMFFEELDEIEIDSDMVYIDRVVQQTNSGILFRDASGVEDNGAIFEVYFSKS